VKKTEANRLASEVEESGWFDQQKREYNRKFYRVVLGILVVWRITHFLQAEDGPGDVVVHLRRHAGEGFWGKLLDCFYCLSVWVAAPLALSFGKNLGERVLLWPSFSAGAILLERITNPTLTPAPALFAEESPEEYHDAMLRSETRANEGNPEGSLSPNQ
jgi:hypothetical protein